jgi:hypothetical protein
MLTSGVTAITYQLTDDMPYYDGCLVSAQGDNTGVYILSCLAQCVLLNAYI